MDLFDDIFNDQSLQFSPLRLSPSPEPFTSIMDILQDPLLEETQTDGLINNSAISEANLSMTAQSPDLIPLPETLTVEQHPPEVDQLLLCSPHGYMQENLPNIQSDQPFLFDQNMLDDFQEPDVIAMQYQQFLYNQHGSLQGNKNGQLDQKSLSNQNKMNHSHKPNNSAIQPDLNFGCNPHSFLQGNSNGQLDQQSLFNQNTMNPFQELNDYTMRGIGQQTEEENCGYAHPVMTQSFEFPNHLQEQFSLPLSQRHPSNSLYQNGLVDSHSNIYDQQPPPLIQANREDEALVPRMVAEVARTYPIQNQTSVTPPISQITTRSTRHHHVQLPQIPTSSTRTCPVQNQIYVTPPLPQIPSISTRDHQVQLPQIPSSSTSNQENAQELVNKPLPGVKYPTLKDYAHLVPSKKAFSPIEFNVLWRQQENGQSRLFERKFSGRRQRNDPSGFNHVESSSAAKRRRTVLPKRNVDLTAVDHGEKRLQNKLYDPLYESLGLKIDPHLRVFSPPKKNGLQAGRGRKENQQWQEPDKRSPSAGKRVGE